MTDSLPVKKILLGALSIPWFRRREYSSALAIPTLIFVVTWALAAIFANKLSTGVAFILPMYALALTLFAVTCHRFILANDRTLGVRTQISLGHWELRFFGWMVATALILGLTKVGIISLLINLHGVTENAVYNPSYWIEQLASIPTYFLLGRICLVFPATAVDRPATLRWSWQQTRGNAWQMFVIVGLFPWLIDSSLWLVWREQATVVEQVLLALVSMIGLSITIFALSFSYKELGKQTR